MSRSLIADSSGSLFHRSGRWQTQRARLRAAEGRAVGAAAAARAERAAQQRRAFAGPRMRREKDLDRPRIAALLVAQLLHEVDHPARVPPGALHDLQPDPIGLALV